MNIDINYLKNKFDDILTGIGLVELLLKYGDVKQLAYAYKQVMEMKLILSMSTRDYPEVLAKHFEMLSSRIRSKMLEMDNIRQLETTADQRIKNDG